MWPLLPCEEEKFSKWNKSEWQAQEETPDLDLGLGAEGESGKSSGMSSSESAVKMQWGGIHKSSQVLPCWQAVATPLNTLLLYVSASAHNPCKCDDVIMWLQLASVSEPMPGRYLPAMYCVRKKDKTGSLLHETQIHWFSNRTLGPHMFPGEQ